MRDRPPLSPTLKVKVGTAGTGRNRNTCLSQANSFTFLRTRRTRSIGVPARNSHEACEREDSTYRQRLRILHVCNKMCRDIRSLKPALIERRLTYNVLPLLQSLREKYIGLLAQLSPSFSATQENINRLMFLGSQFKRLTRRVPQNSAKLFIELRNPTWTSLWGTSHEASYFCKRAGLSIVHVCWRGTWNTLGHTRSRAAQNDSRMAPIITPMGYIWPPYKLDKKSPPYVRLHGAQSKSKGWYDPGLLLKTLKKHGLLKKDEGVLTFNTHNVG